MAENSSKDLLKLEANCAAVSTSSSCLESKLYVCKKGGTFSAFGAPCQKPTMPPLPKSEVLGKVKDFLGVISESNKKLLQEAKDNPNNYDIEVLSGNESKYIEMDLMLGIADLHTPDAVAAAESALAGNQPPLALPESSSGSENDGSSDGEDDDDDDDDGSNKDNTKEQINEADSQSARLETKDAAERDSSCKALKKQKPKKRPKIVELP